MILYPTLDKNNAAKTFELVKGSSHKRKRPDAEEKYGQNIEGLDKFKDRQFTTYRTDQNDWKCEICNITDNKWDA